MWTRGLQKLAHGSRGSRLRCGPPHYPHPGRDGLTTPVSGTLEDGLQWAVRAPDSLHICPLTGVSSAGPRSRMGGGTPWREGTGPWGRGQPGP